MVDRDKIAKHIAELEKYIIQLRELKGLDKEKYLADWKLFYQVDRCLHLMLESFLSIGEMVISEFNLRKPDVYADVPEILAENNIISRELSLKLIDLAKFRNVLVHDYFRLDHERVYEHLIADDKLIEQFFLAIKNILKL